MAKIELQIGEVEFECEGAENWVMKMYEKFLLDFLPKKGVAKPSEAPAPKVAAAPKPKKEKIQQTEVKTSAPKAKKPKAAKKVKAKKPKAKKVAAPEKPAIATPTETKALATPVAPEAKPTKKKATKKAKALKPKAAKTKKAKKTITKATKTPVAPPSIAPKGTMPPLAEFLKMNNANEMLMKKFLVTAVWLHHNGKTRMRPNDINVALMGIGETKFHRPTDSLKTNIKKGYCAREGDKFFVTELGFQQVKM